MKRTVRLNESELKRMIAESVKRILKETSLFTDDPYHDAEYNIRDARWEDYPEGKEGDIEYSWDEYDRMNGNLPIQHKNSRERINREYDGRRIAKDWTPRQLKSADRMKKKWINGEKGLDDLDDAFYGSSL